jgi:HSP20 family protein
MTYFTGKESWDLATDVYEEKGNLIVKMHVSDISPDKLDITLDGRDLTICGSRKSEKEIEKGDYYQKEISTGEFERMVYLPSDVKGEEASATYKEGVLKIVLPKEASSKSKKTKLKVNWVPEKE